MKRLYVGATLFSLLVVAPISYCFFDNETPYEYDDQHSWVVPEVTQAGHQLIVHWAFKRVNRLCPGTVFRTIVDARSGAKTTYDPSPATSLTEEDARKKYLDRSFLLPSGISAGSKIYRANVDFVCNPLHHLRPLKVQTPDLYFEVVNQ